VARILTVLAKSGTEYRDVFSISNGKDDSLYLMSLSEFPDSHISIHTSGDFHVTYGKVFIHGKKLRISLQNGQNLRTFMGCSSPNEYVIDKSRLNQMKRRNISNLKSEIFIVGLAGFETPLIAVTTYIFDPNNLWQFQNQVLEYANPQTKIVSSTIPYIGLIAHEK